MLVIIRRNSATITITEAHATMVEATAIAKAATVAEVTTAAEAIAGIPVLVPVFICGVRIRLAGVRLGSSGLGEDGGLCGGGLCGGKLGGGGIGGGGIGGGRVYGCGLGNGRLGGGRVLAVGSVPASLREVKCWKQGMYLPLVSQNSSIWMRAFFFSASWSKAHCGTCCLCR